MSKRILSVAQRCWLTDEMQVWQEAGILPAESRTQILDLYESSEQSAARRTNWAVFTLMGLAALLVGLAVLLLVGFNWDVMPAALKIGILLGAMAGFYGAAFWLRYRREQKLVAEILFFLGAVIYGVGIWQIAQIFHFHSHYPDGFWIWALGVLPVALCLDTPLLHCLYSALLAIWVGTEILDSHGFGQIFWHHWWRPCSAMSLPLLIAPGILWAYRRGSSVTLGLYVALLTWWTLLQSVAWHAEYTTACLAGGVGAMLLLVGQSHASGNRMAMPYRVCGVLLTAGTLILLSFASFNSAAMHHTQRGAALVTAAVIAVGTAAILGLAAAVRRRRPPETAHVSPGIPPQALPVALAVLMAGISVWTSQSYVPDANYRYYHHVGEALFQPGVLLPTLVANVGLVALAIWLIRLGMKEDRGRPFAIGVLLFILWAWMRYADLFSGFGGMLGAALLFLLCGVALYVMARTWQQRKEAPHE